MRRLLIFVTLLAVFAVPTPGLAQSFASPSFQTLWATTDEPVASGAVFRAWVWGPEPITEGRQETYAESPGGTRLVQYFDKGRMELNTPDDPVTSGLLARELLTGERQIGVKTFEQRTPAEIGVAGDPDDPLGPTYATMGRLMERPAHEENEPLVEVIGRDGSIAIDQTLSLYSVRADVLVPETGHRIANVFRSYFEGTSPSGATGEEPQAAPFAPWYTVTGLPITEAYWARARVGTIPRDVLVQAFERRVLTYTPDNPASSRVEMGNVGQHYLRWLDSAGGSPETGGLPCPPVPARAADATSRLTLLDSALHQIDDRFYISGQIRNNGSPATPVEIVASIADQNGVDLGDYSAFTDLDFWPTGYVAAFRIDLPPTAKPASWQIAVRTVGDDPTGRLAEGFKVENLTGEVGSLGIAKVRGDLRYDGARPFTRVAVLRIHLLDACGSLVTDSFATIDASVLAPGSTVSFSTIFPGAEGAVKIRVFVEARVGRDVNEGATSRDKDDKDATPTPAPVVQTYEGDLYPTPRLPIVSAESCCIYTRAYTRPEGAVVRSVYIKPAR